ncbi:hypothetical protein NCU05828 [Neurospora crassa OR74A]|uniref:Amidohydrolase-related domain-containing protein n=1 Tax=Neurospora crassa (strain ATCC 24698 / 74-OR23-1A / CBS 708.71 / DSM 1257 / FGSC 987) TaxID=367110 RepID=Q7S5L5_NEUCR|nr:hypothetical protein NCU05828 [Neurospora crassa OR74A]EAA30852.1 hypothetical protein NCU05828 [Neurospora crassa OR74A]|eukprot:XP_960088.1 hypothetical protein NCU05828 [Neurospora crassa OR74A]
MDEKGGGLPPYTATAPPPPAWKRKKMRRSRGLKFLAVACMGFIAYAQWRQLPSRSGPVNGNVTVHGLSVQRLHDDLTTCSKLRQKPQDPIGEGREKNARYIDGHAPTLIKNATVWVGEPAKGTSAADARKGKGYSWIKADVYLEYGLIKKVESDIAASTLPKGTHVFDAKGRPLTAGIIDMHSHAGVDSLPSLDGNEDTNELSADITPFVRSIDGIQPNDHQIQVIKSGGVTTSLVLPGSGNNMGGEAYAIKLAVGKPDGRNETSATDMLADPERNWRFMKMACGENAKRVYGRVGEQGPTSRMGESWEFRHAFEQATKLVRAQDDWCDAATAVGVQKMKGYLPQELKWESLGALLRGQIHLNTHCYTIPDLEAFVDHTNEFKFKVRAFHHAHQTYLVPEILKRAYGGDPPASAIFADNMYYKAESYVGSEFAGKYLWDNDLTPIYVSDNPVLNAQHVLFEAAKGHKYGLPYHAALASVTTAPAERLGFGNRLGKIKPGFDADVVVWDSDPLEVGATPVQVWIDGTAQFEHPVVLNKTVPKLIISEESTSTIVEEPVDMNSVVFTGITNVLGDVEIQGGSKDAKSYSAVIRNGKVTCVGVCAEEVRMASTSKIPVIELKDGHFTSSFTAFGSQIGLNAIDAEDSTDNGDNVNVFTRAEDGLTLDTKKLHAAYKYGVTKAITAPKFNGGQTHHGTSVGFLTGATNPLANGTIFASDVAVHYSLNPDAKEAEGTPSLSAAVGALRRKLLQAATKLKKNETIEPADLYSESIFLQKVVNGSLPLVLTVHNADIIAAALRVKKDVESLTSSKIHLAIIGGAESHLVADELAAAQVGVVLAPLQSFATSWDQRRALSGAPLTNGTAIDVLLDAGVTTAIGLEEDWLVRDLGLLAGIAYANGGGKLSKKSALELVSGNVYKILGAKEPKVEEGHFVVFEGSPLRIQSRVKAVSGGLGVVSVF